MPVIICSETDDELSLPIRVIAVGVDCERPFVSRSALQHSCMIFVKHGFGIISVNGKNMRINEGKAAFVAKGANCSLTPESEKLIIDWFTFEISSKTLSYSLFTKNVFTLFEINSASLVRKGIVNIYDCVQPSQNYDGYPASSAAYKLMVDISKSSVTKKKINKKTAALVENVIRYVDENMTKEITLEDLCKEAGGVSEQYLCRLFKKHMGERPVEYILHKRIDMARSYLENTDIPIPIIASSTGFNNTSYFYRNFKKFSGVSPLAYRKNCILKKMEKDESDS